MSHHDLKLLPPYFEAKARGVKPWEIRTTEDRFFCEGDTVIFHEVAWQNGHNQPMPTGKTLGPVTITYILTGTSLVPTGACIFSHTEAHK